MAATAQNLKRLVRFLAKRPPAKDKLRNHIRVEISSIVRIVQARNRTSQARRVFQQLQINGHLIRIIAQVKRGASHAYATTTVVTACIAVKIARPEAIRLLHSDPAFCDSFVPFLVARGSRIQSDLVDQLFNRVEKQLARMLLLMAEYGKPGQEHTLIPKVSQETLATMIGTTRTRINSFMSRFRTLGFKKQKSSKLEPG